MSGIGVAANILLSVIKAIAGVWSGSAALISDSVNNLTDSASSLVTIIGTRMASKKADEEHPFGHKRGEYLTSLAIGIIILMTGLQSLFLHSGEGVSVFLYHKSGKGDLFRSSDSFRAGCKK